MNFLLILFLPVFIVAGGVLQRFIGGQWSDWLKAEIGDSKEASIITGAYGRRTVLAIFFTILCMMYGGFAWWLALLVGAGAWVGCMFGPMGGMKLGRPDGQPLAPPVSEAAYRIDFNKITVYGILKVAAMTAVLVLAAVMSKHYWLIAFAAIMLAPGAAAGYLCKFAYAAPLNVPWLGMLNQPQNGKVDPWTTFEFYLGMSMTTGLLIVLASFYAAIGGMTTF